MAHRHRRAGSVYIQVVCDTLERHANNVDLLSLFTRVHRRVARMDFPLQEPATPAAVGPDMATLKQVPEMKSTLTKRLFFS